MTETTRPRRRRRWRWRTPLLALLLLALVALVWQRPALQRSIARSAEAALVWLDVSPRSLYVLRLHLAGLDDTVAGSRWLTAVERAGDQPVDIDDDSYSEQHTFASNDISARVYRLSLQRGQRLELALSRGDDHGAQLFAALYRRDGPEDDWQVVEPLTGKAGLTALTIGNDAVYRLVLQPELMARVEYTLDIAVGGSLPFPVENAAMYDIGSVFGDPRDGGAREHHGVDIFAGRGTPVLAVVDGRVSTGNGGLGGKHVWLWGGLFGSRYYYAHLDSIAVDSGDSVEAGDIIGRVGNTGNARTTPPHLHFGIYTTGAGPVDPEPFIQPPPRLGTG